MILLINIKTYRQNLETKYANKKIKVISITFMISSVIYVIGTIVIKYLDEDISNVTFVFALLPIILYLIISIYTILTCTLRISNNELKDIGNNAL